MLFRFKRQNDLFLTIASNYTQLDNYYADIRSEIAKIRLNNSSVLAQTQHQIDGLKITIHQLDTKINITVSKEFIDESLQAFKDTMISRIRSEHDQIYK